MVTENLEKYGRNFKNRLKTLDRFGRMNYISCMKDEKNHHSTMKDER